MQHHSTRITALFSSLWKNRSLIAALTKREIEGKYRGSAFGLLWSFFNPLFMLLVYTVVFSVVFKARWNSSGDSKVEFALILFAGLIVFNLFAECIGRAPGLVLLNTNYVKKVVFPIEILPIVSIGAALFHALVSLVVWLIAYILIVGAPNATVIYLPLVLLPLLFLVMGLSWALASLGVYLRDVSQLIGIVITTLMFLSPIFYPASALPEDYRPLLYLNPLTPVIEMVRDVLYWNKAPNWVLLGGCIVVSAAVGWLGFAWFQRTRKGFADVL